MRKTKKTVFVGLSGGVDSSVAALLLKKRGFSVIGVFINSYNVDGCEEEDAEYARRTAEILKIPFYTFDMREQYFSRVIAAMIEGYRKGETPNPDILCNREIKFGLFWEQASLLGADMIATGHYVRKKRIGKKDHIFVAKDANKDQSYFLWKLNQGDLKHCLFPVGEYIKSDIRKIAAKAKLPTATKKDSQGICFLGKVKLPEFLKNYIAPKKGEIYDVEGNLLGEHEGVQFYTIGQRHIGTSLKIKNIKKISVLESPQPYYVVSKNIEKNILVVAKDNDPNLFRKELSLTDINFTSPDMMKKDKEHKIFARVRYRQILESGVLKKEKDIMKLIFEKPVKFVALGQSAVFYSDKGELLGGGVIT